MSSKCTAMTISKNTISISYNKDGKECLLTGWYKISSQSKLKVYMDAPFAGLCKCEEMDTNTTLESEATQCLQILYEEALEIMQHRDKLAQALSKFRQVIADKKQKRPAVEKRLEQATTDIERCMVGLILDNWHDNQCEWYDILEKEGVFINADLSNVFVILRYCRNAEDFIIPQKSIWK